jgi:hypothetical protein
MNYVTIISPISVIGSNGTKKIFKPYYQYCYEEDVTIDGCDCCPSCSHESSLYYKIIFNAEEFLIPSEYGVKTNLKTRCEKQDLHEYWKLRNEQPKDMYKVTKELLGIDIKAGNTVVHNGYDYARTKHKNIEPGEVKEEINNAE